MRLITKKSELLSISKFDEIELANDIDFEGEEISCLIPDFHGRLIGNSHSIKNITIKEEVWDDGQTIGLFWYLTDATVSDIFFDNIVFVYDCGLYKPRIASLVVEADGANVDRVTMNVFTKDGNDIPLVCDSNSCSFTNINYNCNKN